MTLESISHIMKVIEKRGVEAWWTDAQDDPGWILPGLEGTYIRGKDTMDVWFDSGTSWTMLPERARGTPVADVYLEGSDQHRGWFQSSLLTHVASQFASGRLTGDNYKDSTAPFKTLITHGFTLDQDGRKMSKSLGNVIAPEEITAGTLLPPISKKQKKQRGKAETKVADGPSYDAMGADALRLWVAGSDYTKDVVVGLPVLQGVHTSLHKLRVTFKWLVGVLSDFSPSTTPSPQESLSSRKLTDTYTLIDMFALQHLHVVTTQVHAAYSNHEFFKAVIALNKYINTDLSAFYFETLKDRLYAGSAQDRILGQAVLYEIFNHLLMTLGPLTPLLVEEVWEFTPEKIKTVAEHPLRRVWVPAPSLTETETETLVFERTIQMVNLIHGAIKTGQEKAREAKRMGGGLDCDVIISLNPQSGGENEESSATNALVRKTLVEGMEDALAAIFVVSKVKFQHPLTWTKSTPQDWLGMEEFDGKEAGSGFIELVKAQGAKCPRCWRHVAPSPDELCSRCDEAITEPVTQKINDSSLHAQPAGSGTGA